MSGNRKLTDVQKKAIQKKLSRIDLPFTEFAVRTLSRTADLPASIDEVSHGDAAAMIEFGHDSSWRRGHAAPYPCSEMVIVIAKNMFRFQQRETLYYQLTSETCN